MVDAVEQARAEAAESLQRGDNRAANAAYARELAALSGSVTVKPTAEELDAVLALQEGDTDTPSGSDGDDGIDWKALREDVADDRPASDDKAVQPDEGPPEPEVPVPVDVSDALYRDFGTRFGHAQAELLQRALGDRVLHNERVVEAVLEDHKELDEIIGKHHGEGGYLNAEGADAALGYVLTRSSFKTSEEWLAAHPEFIRLYAEHVTADGGLSPVGQRLLLEYLGRASGYRFKHTGPPSPGGQRSTQSKEQMTMTDETPESMTEEQFAQALDQIRARIQAAADAWDSRRRDRAYAEELALIARRQGGARPIVGGRGTDRQRTA